jgi:zinc transport system substrate-binding protein
MWTVIRLAFPLLFLTATLAFATPRVVVSIKPVHALVAAVMQGVAEPLLLLDANTSPHTASLKPSQARAINDADLVFWIGPELESFLAKPLASRADAATAFLDDGSIRKAAEITEEPTQHDDHAHDHGSIDPHVWLDPQLAKRMAQLITARLSSADPAHADTYQSNGAALGASLDALDHDIGLQLAGAGQSGFVVFHDGFNHFSRRYHLRDVGVITINPDVSPGAERITELREQLLSGAASCVFSEPQFNPKLVETITDGTEARTGILDPLGSNVAAGPLAYEMIMRNLARGVADCLIAK